ncbi:MarR family winged helix-turn-helix transcriptional regulator [Marinobacterium arenosum]|uniref:MarR family winged helix-turn-helix transcriptional regulator n=1 Tax=Marinobacterium arenosum TaxID=2862496 RepID=UPI001C98D370|nr:MarR family transcriptional regulator [Marinobacterium arenosum]MBY4676033.1 MarR family transcriptional regulator [Marinobacterium arenosum]
MENSSCEALKLDNQLCFAIYSTSLTLNKLYKPLLQQLGLTYPQYLIMLVLWEQDDITLSQLSKRLGQDMGALSPVIKRLEAQGLITRQRSEADDRKIHLRLTEEGQALQQQAEAVPSHILCASGLSVEQALTLKQQLDELRQTLQEVGVQPLDAKT